MNISNIPFSELPMLAKMDKAYAEQAPALRPFYKYPTTLASFQDVINDKSKENINREMLVSTFKKQYSAFDTESVANSQIEKLSQSNTFTVTTAHQPSLFTGPLYFIYKICSTINLAKILCETYPDNQFVPVFVIGGEDHDFEEVNYINIFNKKLTWNRSENVDPDKIGGNPAEIGKGGAVGMMQSHTLKDVLEELKSILGTSERAQEIFNIIEKCYTQHALYQDATQHLLHELFGEYGLVVLNMNDADLKRLFIPIIKREISEQPSKAFVEKTQGELDKLGFKSQAFPREINLFYLKENLRERIVFENGVYKVLNTHYQWNSLSEILKEVDETPQYFSPNVVLRPLYQEVVLPNLAYIGGGGELAYWLERKEQFEYFGVNFPMLIRRNSVLWLDKGSSDKMEKLNIQLLDLVQDTDILIKQYVSKISTTPLSMEDEKSKIEAIFNDIVSKAISIDPTLEKTVLAEKTKQIQAIEMIEGRLMKAEKQKNETTLNQVKALAQKFFPNGGLQERTDNFLPFYLKHGRSFFDVLLENLNPLEQGLIVISE
jgi:bacillithiol synthase